MVSGKGVLEEARRLLGASGDVVAILGTMKSLVAAADLQGVAQQKLERDTDIGGNGRPRLKRWESAPGLPPHVHSSRVLGGGQELLRPQAALRDGGGVGGAGSCYPGIRGACSSLTMGSGCSRFSCGNDPCPRASFGSGWCRVLRTPWFTYRRASPPRTGEVGALGAAIAFATWGCWWSSTFAASPFWYCWGISCCSSGLGRPRCQKRIRQRLLGIRRWWTSSFASGWG